MVWTLNSCTASNEGKMLSPLKLSVGGEDDTPSSRTSVVPDLPQFTLNWRQVMVFPTVPVTLGARRIRLNGFLWFSGRFTMLRLLMTCPNCDEPVSSNGDSAVTSTLSVAAPSCKTNCTSAL